MSLRSVGHVVAIAIAALAGAVAAAEEPPPGTAEESAQRFGAFGLGSQDYWVSAPQFAPLDYSRPWGADAFSLYHSNRSTIVANYVAQIDLPAGAVITSLECYFFDGASLNDGDVLLERISYLYGTDVPGASVLATVGSAGNSGYQKPYASLNATLLYRDGDYRNFYVLQATMPPDTAVRLRGCRILWHRSVAPAPATATFGDVPTTHPQFRFVEALVAAGITGGCGASAYCPDAPLTRGQMAVFLSTALGLHFPY